MNMAGRHETYQCNEHYSPDEVHDFPFYLIKLYVSRISIYFPKIFKHYNIKYENKKLAFRVQEV